MILEDHKAGGSSGSYFLIFYFILFIYFFFFTSISIFYRIFHMVFDCAMQHADWRNGECRSESPQNIPIWEISLLNYL